MKAQRLELAARESFVQWKYKYGQDDGSLLYFERFKTLIKKLQIKLPSLLQKKIFEQGLVVLCGQSRCCRFVQGVLPSEAENLKVVNKWLYVMGDSSSKIQDWFYFLARPLTPESLHMFGKRLSCKQKDSSHTLPQLAILHQYYWSQSEAIQSQILVRWIKNSSEVINSQDIQAGLSLAINEGIQALFPQSKTYDQQCIRAVLDGYCDEARLVDLQRLLVALIATYQKMSYHSVKNGQAARFACLLTTLGHGFETLGHYLAVNTAVSSAFKKAMYTSDPKNISFARWQLFEHLTRPSYKNLASDLIWVGTNTANKRNYVAYQAMHKHYGKVILRLYHPQHALVLKSTLSWIDKILSNKKLQSFFPATKLFPIHPSKVDHLRPFIYQLNQLAQAKKVDAQSIQYKASHVLEKYPDIEVLESGDYLNLSQLSSLSVSQAKIKKSIISDFFRQELKDILKGGVMRPTSTGEELWIECGQKTKVRRVTVHTAASWRVRKASPKELTVLGQLFKSMPWQWIWGGDFLKVLTNAVMNLPKDPATNEYVMYLQHRWMQLKPLLNNFSEKELINMVQQVIQQEFDNFPSIIQSACKRVNRWIWLYETYQGIYLWMSDESTRYMQYMHDGGLWDGQVIRQYNRPVIASGIQQKGVENLSKISQKGILKVFDPSLETFDKSKSPKAVRFLRL